MQNGTVFENRKISGGKRWGMAYQPDDKLPDTEGGFTGWDDGADDTAPPFQLTIQEPGSCCKNHFYKYMKEERNMKLFQVADRYCKESNWKTLALLKICLFSIGIMIGVMVPSGRKRTALRIAAATFLVTYLPLMGKFFRTWQAEEQEKTV